MLVLYHDWDSVCSFKVRMCLLEKGQEYESRRISLNNFEHLQPDYLAINPNGLVPTLIHDDRIVLESSMINEFLEEIYPEPLLMPVDPYARAKMRVLVKQQDDVLYHAQRPATFQLMVKRMLANLTPEQIDATVSAHPEPARAQHFIEWATGPRGRQSRRRCETERRARADQAGSRTGGRAMACGGEFLACRLRLRTVRRPLTAFAVLRTVG